MPTVAPLDLEGHCVTAAFVGEIPFFALADGNVHRLDSGHKTSHAHDGLLTAVLDPAGGRLLTGGEDGRIAAVKADGSVERLAEIGRKWVTSVAPGPQGAIAFATGRT